MCEMGIYRKNQDIEIATDWGKMGPETEIAKCNTQATGRYGGYLNYFKCGICKKQCVGDDNPFSCNNEKYVYDKTDNKRYCLNFTAIEGPKT